MSEAAGGSPSSLFGPDTADPQQQAGPRLGVQHIRIPQQYIAARYPLTHASISPDGMDIAVAGTRGLGLYSRRSSRWRLFGDVSQEREIMVQVGPSHVQQINISYVFWGQMDPHYQGRSSGLFQLRGSRAALFKQCKLTLNTPGLAV